MQNQKPPRKVLLSSWKLDKSDTPDVTMTGSSDDSMAASNFNNGQRGGFVGRAQTTPKGVTVIRVEQCRQLFTILTLRR